MAEASPAFVRKASGLVRDISPVSFLFYGLLLMGIFYELYYWVALAPLVGGNLFVGMLIYAVAMLATATVYYAFIVMMPRSGGDYVFVSRAFHPVIGFIGNFVFGLLLLLFAAVTAVTIETTALSVLFGYLGVVYSNPSWLGLATAISTSQWIIPLGLLWIISSGVIAVVSMRVYLRVQNIAFILVLLGFLALIAVLLSTTHESYVTAFNAFASQYMGKPGDYYNQVISQANAGGFQIPDQTSLWGSVLLFPVLAIAGLFQWSAQLSGEIRNPKKSALIGLLGGAAFFLIILYVALLATYNTMGFNFLSSVDYLLYNAPNQIPLPAYAYAGMLTVVAANPIVAVFIILMSTIQLIMYMPTTYLYMSRGFFAYSFDGVLPQWFTKINGRTHGPLRSVLASILITCILFAVVNVPGSATYAYLFGSVYTWLSALLPTFFVGLAALLIAKYRPSMHALSPIKGVKLQLLGLTMVILTLLLTYLELTNGVYGANTPIAIELAVAIVILVALVYVAARLKKGSMLELSFKEVPPA